MKGKQYIITSEHFNGSVTYTYNLKGWLIAFNLDISNIQKDILMFFYKNIPDNLEIMQEWINKAGNFKVEEVPADISFERFWIEYGKYGTKGIASKKYDRLKPIEKIAAILGIKAEKARKQKDGTALPYAETYINQKRW